MEIRIKLVGCGDFKEGVYTIVDCMNETICKNRIDILETEGVPFIQI